MKNSILLVLLAISSVAYGQAVRVDIPLWTYGSTIPSSAGPLPQALLLANATVSLCVHPASLSSCTPVVTYNDSSEDSVCPPSTPLVQLPGTTCTSGVGIGGNLGFWYGGGQIDYLVTPPVGQTQGPFTINGGVGLSIPIPISFGGTGASTAITALANLNGISSVKTTPQTLASPISAPVIANIVYADRYCTTPGVYDQSCLSNAISVFGNNTRYVIPTNTYIFSSQYTMSNLSNVIIEGSGPGTIIQKDGISLECDSCTDITVKNINFQTITSPTLVASSQLPTLSGFTPIVIERFGGSVATNITAWTITSNTPCFTSANSYTAGQVVFLDKFTTSGAIFNDQNFVVSSSGLSGTQFCGTNPQFSHANASGTETGIAQLGSGYGYIPAVNDTDLVPVANGGACTVGCYSATQFAEAFDTGIIFRNALHEEVSGLVGNYFSITNYDGQWIDIHDNQVNGGKNFACIAMWLSSAGSKNIVVSNNTVYSCSYDGIMVGGTDHAAISNNVIGYVGESGIKTYQNSPYQNTNISITGNVAEFTWYDGLDLGSNFPHTSAFVAHSTATGNTSIHDHGSGVYADGQDWTFVGNHAINNWNFGMGLDFCNSNITGNVSTGNNRGQGGAGVHQMIVSGNVSCGGNLVSSNITDTKGNVGYGLAAGGAVKNILVGNTELTGTDLINAANYSSLNTDSTGFLPFLQTMGINATSTQQISYTVQNGGNYIQLAEVGSAGLNGGGFLPNTSVLYAIGSNLALDAYNGEFDVYEGTSNAEVLRVTPTETISNVPISANNGSTIVYRCTVAGTLPIGALTINAANCGASGTSDTGLRVN